MNMFFSADQQHHLRIDDHESPDLPGQEGPHEERETCWLGREDIRINDPSRYAIRFASR